MKRIIYKIRLSLLRNSKRIKSYILKINRQSKKSKTKKPLTNDDDPYTVKSLYKEKMSGKMPEKFFYSLLSDYQKELESLEEKLPSLRDRVIEEKNQEQNVIHWTNSVSKYLKIQKLDRSLARELIDSIIVSELTSVDGKSSQDITINYKFVGNLQKFFGKEKNAA